MIDNIKRNYLNIFMFVISSIGYTILLQYIFKILDVYNICILYILVVLYLLFGLFYYLKKYLYCKILYYISLFIFLFLRKSETGYNFSFYLIEWLQYIFKNRIILINILGNIILFIPMGIFNKHFINSIFIIILIELMQLILKKGIFDVVDIVLNIIGVIFGFLGVFLWKKTKKRKRKK